MLRVRPAALALALVCSLRPALADPQATAAARKFVAAHEARLRPLEIAAAIAWWDANISGKDEDFAKKEAAQNRIDEAMADAKAFAEVKALKAAGGIDDPVTARAIEVLYLSYLEKQVDPQLLKQINAKSNAVEQKFNAFRAKVGGKDLTDNEVRDLLRTGRDSAKLKEAWEASKAVGSLLKGDLTELIRLRNAAAVKLGYKNFHALQLALNEQDGDELLRLFDQLDELTRGPFLAVKAEIDAKLAANAGIKVEDLMPWHYHDPFFQETPNVFAADLDAPFAKADLVKLTTDFYAGLGLPVADVVARSDLYDKPGKSPHAFCTDIDAKGDVRVLANVVKNNQWMSTLLHEFGHSVYSSKNIPAALPACLRCEAHILTTEGVAMMFERLSKRRAWLEKMGVPMADPAAYDAAGAKTMRCNLLIFSRWCQVMLRFEKSMYENPDQDLGKLWWDLVEKYQGLRRPPGRTAPDYASKVHIVTAPVYYHNYMLGELFASQVHHAIARDVYAGANPDTVVYVGNPAVGDFMKKRVFEPGRTLPWNALTKHATGEPLNPKFFAADFRAK